MKESLPFIFGMIIMILFIWLSSVDAINRAAEDCGPSWGKWGHDVKNTRVWFNCEGRVFEKRFSSFKKNLPEGWKIDSVVHNPPEGGYRRGTSVFLSRK